MGSGVRDVTSETSPGVPMWAESVVVGQQKSFLGSGTGKRPSKSKDDDRELTDLLQEHRFHKQASFEIPMRMSEGKGVWIEPNGANVSMSCHMPPSRVDGKWSGTIEGGSKIGADGNAAEASGSLALQCKTSSWSQITGGIVQGSSIHYPLVMIGGTLLVPKQQSAVGVTFYQNPSFLHPSLWEHAMASFFFRHRIPNTNWRISSRLSRRQQLSASASNGKVNCSISANLRSFRNPKASNYPSLRISLRPSISVYRRVMLDFSVASPSVWQVGASLLQQLHGPAASIGVGFRLVSTRGLEWIFSVNRGEATVRIPILLSQTVYATATLGQTLYMSMISFLLQEAIADFWGWTKMKASESSSEDVVPSSAAQDAKLQHQVMARKAKHKTQQERESKGLVILSATYAIKGGDSFDVTTPLQFWVDRSTLSLPAVSKSSLLGFYDLTKSFQEEKKGSKPADTAMYTVLKRSWRELWEYLPASNDKALKKTVPTPTLTVTYAYGDESYQVSINDEDPLTLPAVIAVPIDQNKAQTLSSKD